MKKRKKGFQRKKVESLTLGEYLRKMRKKKHISVAEFAKKTRIQKKYVRALEEGRYEDMPAKVYVKGFVHTYEMQFNVYENALVKLFDREYQIYENIKYKKNGKKELTLSRMQSSRRPFLTQKGIIAIGIAILFGSIVGYLYYGVDQFVSAPWINVETPANNVHVETPSITVRGITHPEAHVTINGQDVVVTEEGFFLEDIGLQFGENTLMIRSVNSFEKEAHRTIRVFRDGEHYKEEIDDIQKEPVSEVFTIDVRIGETATWVAIKADDIAVLSATLPENSSHTFNAKEKISITAGIGNMVLISRDGEMYSVLAETEDIVRDVVFTHKGRQESL